MKMSFKLYGRIKVLMRADFFVLVEFPNLLYEGFYPCLTRLQQMGGDDMAFSNYIAPRVSQDFILDSLAATAAGHRKQIAVLSPVYSQVHTRLGT
jgi:hypothetical protein